MAEVINPIEGPLLLSIRRLAIEFDLSRMTISDRLKVAGVEPSGERLGKPVFSLRDAIKACFAWTGPGPGQEGFNPDRLEPKQRRDFFASEVDRLRVEKTSAHLVPAADVETEMAKLVLPMAAMLENLPDVLERDCNLEPEQVQLMQRIIDGERARLYEALQA